MTWQRAIRRALQCTLVMLLAGGQMAQATKEPEFTVLARLGEVEIRRYGAAIEAVTPMPAAGGNNGGFRRLAGYIFGGNSSGESIAMTAPVQQNLTGDARRMTFFMPGEYDMASLPAPRDPEVTLREVPARTVAVQRFSGRATSSRVAAQRAELATTLEREGIAWRGDWLLNQYNPPWTLPPLRRNEIWVRIDWQTGMVGAGAE